MSFSDELSRNRIPAASTIKLRRTIGSLPSTSVSKAYVADDSNQNRIWDDLPRHLRIKKKTTYIRRHSDLKISSVLTIIKLLMWKNSIVMKRQWKTAVLQFFAPLVIIIIMLICHLNTEKPGYNDRVYDYFNVDTFDKDTHLFQHCDTVYLSPKNPVMEELRGQMEAALDNFKYEFLDPKYQKTYPANLCAWIEFYKKNWEGMGPSPPTTFRPKISYAIRFPAVHAYQEKHKSVLSFGEEWDVQKVYPDDWVDGVRDRDTQTGGHPGYYNNGFLHIQHRLATELMRMIVKHAGRARNDEQGYVTKFEQLLDKVTVRLRRFPFPAHASEDRVRTIANSLPICLVVGYTISCAVMAYLSVREREMGVRQLLKMYGIHEVFHKYTWVLHNLLFQSFSAVIMTMILTTSWKNRRTSKPLFEDDFFGVVFLLLMICYIFNVISSTACISVCLVWTISFLPYQYTKDRLQTLNFGIFVKLLLCVPCNTALGFGCQLLAKLQAVNNINLRWKLILQDKAELNIVWIMVILLASGVVQVLAAQYVSRVYSETSSHKLPWNFLFKGWFWKDQHPPDTVPSDIQNEESFETEHPAYYEDDSHTKQRKELCVENLSKYYGQHRILHKVNLICYQGHATVLLGDKGSGKSSLLKMITGSIVPSSGVIFLSRKDLHKNPIMGKAFVGYCPSENLLFPDFTVAETLAFFISLKCTCNRIEAYEEVERFLKLTMLSDFRNTRISELTKCSQRMVMIASAFCGGSRVVLLDDPTISLSPSQQTVLWDFISHEKKHRTILIAMEACHEIDNVVDKLVLFHYGQVTAKGSPEFLKTKFGGGYHLELQVAQKLDFSFVKDLIRRRVEGSSIFKESDTDIDFYLPQSQTPSFPGLLAELETLGSSYGVVDFKIKFVTLEELHLRLKRLSTSLDDYTNDPTHHNVTRFFKSQPHSSKKKEAHAGLHHGPEAFRTQKPRCSSCLQEFWLMFMKNVRVSIRSKLLFCASTFLTLCMLISFIWIAKLVELVGHSTSPLKLIVGKDFGHKYIVTDLRRSTNEGFYMRDAVADVLTSLSGTSPPVVSVDYDNSEDIVKHMLIQYNIVENETEVGYFGIEVIPTKVNKTDLKEKYKVGLTGYFNNQPLHTPPIALSLVDNILFRHMEGYMERVTEQEYKPKKFRLQVSNHPLGYQPADFVKFSQLLLGPGYFFGMFTSFSYAFIIASYIIMHIQEQEFRYMQLAFGANKLIFWGTNYLYNFLHFTFIALVHTLVLFLANLPGLSKDIAFKDRLPVMVDMFIFTELYGFTGVCIVGSWASAKFKGWGIGYSKVVLTFILTGPLLMMILIPIEYASSRHPFFKGLYLALANILTVFPGYAYGRGLYQLIANQVHLLECPLYKTKHQTVCSPKKVNIFNEFDHSGDVPDSCCFNQQSSRYAFVMYGIGRNTAVLVIISTCCILQKILVHTKLFRTLKKKILDRRSKKWTPVSMQGPTAVQDYDVLLEAAKLYRGQGGHDLTIKNLTLETPQYVQLDNISMEVRKGECFAFLGATGAGKTTFLKTLMGYEYLPTYGDADFQGLSLIKDYAQYVKRFSCSLDYNQFLGELKGDEVLHLMGVLRCIPKSDIEDHISCIGENLGMTVELEQYISTYSEVSKKKLSVAVAMMGAFDVLLLDDPTHHLDAKSRSFILKSVRNLLKQGCIVIWASHGIEQCEAICNKMSILVNGHLKCIGTFEHLRELYQEGYTVIAKILLDKDMIYFTSKKNRKMENRLRERQSLDGDETEGPRTRKPTSRKSMLPSILLQPDLAKEFAALEPWEQDLCAFVAFFERNFPDAILVDRQPGYIHYHVHTWSAQLSELYTTMEEAKLVADVDSYYITISNLDQVFYNFSRDQITNISG